MFSAPLIPPLSAVERAPKPGGRKGRGQLVAVREVHAVGTRWREREDFSSILALSRVRTQSRFPLLAQYALSFRIVFFFKPRLEEKQFREWRVRVRRPFAGT